MHRRSVVPLALLLVVPLMLPSTAVAAGRRVVPQGVRAPASPPADALTRAAREGRIDRATYALERARALIDLAGVRARYGDVGRPDGREATMVLRDLFLLRDELRPGQRAVADALLARPTDGSSDDFGAGYTTGEATPYCSANGCFHYVTTTADAPPLTDANANAVPDWVETTATEFEFVWSQQIGTLGFRAPKSDETSDNNGGDGRIDVYLAQIADDGLYGYCASDDPADFSGSYPYFDASAFCVVDNDFVRLGGLSGLQATLAHEFFHAVQAGYDWFEDRWFMESTAAWMEERVFDDINDNAQYLDSGLLGRPNVPLDSNNTNFGIYGNWIFHEFISQSFASDGAADTAVVREAWERADASAVGPDMYSIQAIDAALKAEHGVTFRDVFADFGMRNDVPAAFYEEARALSYPVPPLADRVKVTRYNGGGAGSVRLKHLTNAYVAFSPGRGVTSTARIRLAVDLPDVKTGSEASVSTVTRAGAVRYRALRLKSNGVGAVRVPFGRGTIATVDLVLTNASTRRGRCWRDEQWRYACAAFPKDDNLTFAFRATLLN